MDQPSEPTEVPRRLQTNLHFSTRKRTVKPLRLLRVAEMVLPTLSRLQIYKRYLLETGMKITAYNHHARLLLPSSWSFSSNQST